MSKSEERLRIFELFRRGISVSEVSKTSKIPQRTLYRWFTEWKNKEDKEDKEEATPLINEVVREVKKSTESQLNINFNDDWADIATKQSIEHSLVNGQIARALSNILIKEIQKSDINYRAVGALSASISVHSKLHREYGLFYLLDINKAFKLIENEGYTITDVNEEQDPAAE